MFASGIFLLILPAFKQPKQAAACRRLYLIVHSTRLDRGPVHEQAGTWQISGKTHSAITSMQLIGRRTSAFLIAKLVLAKILQNVSTLHLSHALTLQKAGGMT